VIVELGTNSGNAYFAFCQNVKEKHHHANCYAVNNWMDSALFEELSSYNDQHYQAFSVLLRKSFDDALLHFSNHSIDLLHIDSTEPYEAIQSLFESWLPKLSNQGVILFHNITFRNLSSGIAKLWEELSNRYPHLALNNDRGLGVLAVGSIQNSVLSVLISNQKYMTDQQNTVAFFENEGRLIETAHQNNKLQHALTECNIKIRKLEKIIKFNEEESNALRTEIFGLTNTKTWAIRKFIRKAGNSINKRVNTFSNQWGKSQINKDAFDSFMLNIENSDRNNTTTIGIYNSSWNFCGGGENYALSLASELQKKGSVYLIADSDFNIQEIEMYFSINLSQCKKIVISNFNTAHTRHFKLFINADWRSNIDSLAEVSLYLVFFPFRNINKKILKSYYFIFISEYTKKWAIKFWGNHIKGDILYPVKMLQYKTKNIIYNKEKIILSVGRFFSGGHCKNQLEIVKVFTQLISEYPEAHDWKLILAGSIDFGSIDNAMYYHQVITASKGFNIEILTNISRGDLDNLFKRSALYIHAAGLRQNKYYHPENHEHFGITVLEATLAGCIPIVYNIGGPAEIVSKLGMGYTYNSASTMQKIISQIINNFNNNNEEFIKKSSAIAEQSRLFILHESSKEILGINNLKP